MRQLNRLMCLLVLCVCAMAVDQLSNADVLVLKSGKKYQGQVTDVGDAYVLDSPEVGRAVVSKSKVKEWIREKPRKAVPARSATSRPAPASAPVSEAPLAIDKVQVTRKPQTIIDQIRNNAWVSRQMSAEAGQSFLIVHFALHVRAQALAVNFADDLLWVGRTGKKTVRGYGKMSGSKDWNALFSGRKFAKGIHPWEMLYVVPSDQVGGSSIRLAGRDYALPAKSSIWQRDVTLFRQATARAVQPFTPPSQTQIGGAEEKAKTALEPFKGHEIVWQITFQSFEPSGEIKFKEAFPAAGKGSFAGKAKDFVHVTIRAAAESRAEWVAVKPGTAVGCRGKIADFALMTRWTANKRFAGWMIAITVEGAAPVSRGATKQREGNLHTGRQGPAAATSLPSSIRWPEGTGYVTKPEKRPTSPHPKRTHTDGKRTNAKVIEVREGQLITKGNVEAVFDGGRLLYMLRNPGAHITNASKNRSEITIPDFNGDKCVIPYGMTVRVDEFGQFVPVKYFPEKEK